MRTVAGILIALAITGSAQAQDGAPPPQEETELDWRLRFGARIGGAFISYEEDLSQVETDFDSGAFTARLSLEGNLSGLSPYLSIQTDVSAGDEDASLPMIDQENDLTIATFLLDVGIGYRIDLGDLITVVPAVTYTYDLMLFDREEFEQNGTPVSVTDLDGRLQDSVGESIASNGISGRLAIEIRPVSIIDIHLHAVFTYLPDTRVDNDIGGTVSTDGYMIRGGVAAYFWILPQLGIGGEIQLLYRLLDKSSLKVRTGSAFSATIQFPDSETLMTGVSFGFIGRF